MSELKAIVRATLELRRSGRSFLVATVACVRGSSYRRPGARMILADERWVAGAISGGFLERDLAARGATRIATRDGSAALVTYDASADDEVEWGLGIGEGGSVDVLVERIGPEQRIDPLAIMARVYASQQPTAIATIWQSAAPEVRVGARVTVAADGSIASEGVGEVLRERIVEDCRRVIGAGAALVRSYTTYGSQVEALVEPVSPPPRVFVFGAGPDVAPIIRIAEEIGWDAIVCDPLARWATRERFAFADEVLLGTLPEIAVRLDGAHRAVAVICGHDYEADRAALDLALRSRTRYIGVLGPRRRTAQMLADIGRVLGDDDRVHAPVGLALGAETPHEIAVAIVAEMQAVLARTGSLVPLLREKVA